ncbi:MAG: 6-carboxytetrahydropterin synthase QueD [Treponema sp.]|jgi:6-pyruvoyltetrahydropterin/6-carboxytetrahydropterin synthase|nr:6-carboxytetrahydropterin synthase QueD [Treponema sp.]
MYTIRVEAAFSAAHFLQYYRGKCEHLHGHNYRVRLWARGEELDEGGMLIDFARLKDALRAVCGALDHSNLNDMPLFSGCPSAERIARYIFEETARRLSPAEGTILEAVDVYETPDNMARYAKSPKPPP